MISFDPKKRESTLRERGLDFADAETIFDGTEWTIEDKRKAYGEDRFITFRVARHRLVVIVWTTRDQVKRIISMRKANDREQARYRTRLG